MLVALTGSITWSLRPAPKWSRVIAPDARLGWFGEKVDLTRAVLELKAPGADLDAKQGAGYGKLTRWQAFGYAAKVDGCRWVIVNFLEVRLGGARTYAPPPAGPKVLDRCLFICFCEDLLLLPAEVLRKALTTRARVLSRSPAGSSYAGCSTPSIKGLPAMRINAYNGGLFAKDPALEALIVSDASLDGLRALADYDFETDLNVNILGHIFEQSITDLEAIRADIHGGATDPQQSRRKREGIFYTPDRITRFMVARAIGGWLAARYAGP